MNWNISKNLILSEENKTATSFILRIDQHTTKPKLVNLQCFQDILIELLDSLIYTRIIIRKGRPFNDFKEMIFCCIMRSYQGKSSRRSVSFLDYALAKQYIIKKPHFNTFLNYYKDKAITSILKYLIEKSGNPLRKVEVDFTIDSSGFSTSLFGRWLDVRIQSPSVKRIFKKAHVTSGVKSNIITTIEVTPGYFADSPQFKELIQITSRTFQIREVSADKAYSAPVPFSCTVQIYQPIFEQNTFSALHK